ncbi:hypothetical protein EHO59_00340 [Leptospira semungkisensis]|uniref:Uncharacterized protein n=1 Tax=Leptospira semungkisensis TaxID=2484985 RepID=A0A4R9G765_9LEPT|nr:hypothetical protein [Leptospira semungkisensis]TGK06627.1 hypothetical protein EHO59_00340 [Leptospira semungkisensis]
MLRKLNFSIGLILLIAFPITGLYMQYYFRPEHLTEMTARMEMRANHIYILFVSLLNLLSFTSLISYSSRFAKSLDFISRILFLTAGVFSFIAFLKEHTGTLKGRWFTFLCVLSSLIGTVFFATAYILSQRSKSSES